MFDLQISSLTPTAEGNRVKGSTDMVDATSAGCAAAPRELRLAEVLRDAADLATLEARVVPLLHNSVARKYWIAALGADDRTVRIAPPTRSG